MDRCEVCGNRYDKAFRVIAADDTSHVFDCFECAIHALAPSCAHCACRIIGHGVDRGELMFCCDHCAREASSDAVDAASRDSFPASDPPAFAPSAQAGARRPRDARRLQEGKIGWALLWLLGVPVPILLVAFLLRGCT